MKPRSRKRLFDVLRIVICLAALWIVVQGVTLQDHIVLKQGGAELVGQIVEEGDAVTIVTNGGEERRIPYDAVAVDEQGRPRIAYGLKTAWRNSSKLLLLLAVLLHFPVAFLQAIRLKWLLGAQDIRIRYVDCVRFSFAGNFLNFATPLGSHAGDVFKAYFVTTHTPHKTEAVTTIALDRAIGLGTLIVCVAGITTFYSGGGRLAEFRPYVLSVCALGVLAVLAYYSKWLRRYCFPARWLSRLSIFTQLQRIDHAARVLGSRKGVVAAAVLATLALQILAIGAYFVVAVALALDAGLGNVLEYYAYFYTGAVIQALPGPPQGLGTVELAYRYFLAPFGSPSQILCVAFLVRMVVLVCAIPGLFVTLTGSYRPRGVSREPDASPANSAVLCDSKCDLVAI